MATPLITVSYNGGEKKVALSVQPRLELSDSEVDRAESELHRVLRKLFNMEQDSSFYLHEVESKRVMSKESFREPSYCQNFPTHWYLVMDSYPAANGNTHNSLVSADSFQVSCPSLHVLYQFIAGYCSVVLTAHCM